MPPILPFYYLCKTNPHKIMEMLNYFYHPDHTSTRLSTGLGSSSWITDRSGQAIQHLHYLPFGEDWVDQRNSSWTAPYTFSGKEKDVETGYGYFGARYYDSDLSIWLSVDPMSDKYPSMSPYNYCANNPVILVDPDGRIIIPAASFRGTNFEKVFNYLNTNNFQYSTHMALFLDQNNNKYKLSLSVVPTLPNNAGGFCTNVWGPRTITGKENEFPGIIYTQTSGESFHEYLATYGSGTLTLYHFYILIHETGHTLEIFYPKYYSALEGHSRYVHAKDRIISIWNELNTDMNLNLTSGQIFEIYLHGAKDSDEYKSYINKLRFESGRTYDKEVEVFEGRVNEILNRPASIE